MAMKMKYAPLEPHDFISSSAYLHYESLLNRIKLLEEILKNAGDLLGNRCLTYEKGFEGLMEKKVQVMREGIKITLELPL